MLNILNKLSLLKDCQIEKLDFGKIIDQEFLTTRQRVYQVIENLIAINNFWRNPQEIKYHHLCESDYWIGLDILFREIFKDYKDAIGVFYKQLEHTYCHDSKCLSCNILTINVSFLDRIKALRRLINKDEMSFIQYMRHSSCHYYLSDYGISSRDKKLGRRFHENDVFYNIVKEFNGDTMLLAKSLSQRLNDRFILLGENLVLLKKIKLSV